MTLTFVLLGLAIVSVWFPPIGLGGTSNPPWPLLFAAAIVAGWWSGVLTPVALISLFALRRTACGGPRPGRLDGALRVLAGLIALAMALHLLPGFRNPVLFADLRLTPDAKPFTLSLNFDKGAAGLVLLAAWRRRFAGKPRWGEVAAQGVAFGLGTAALAIGAAVLAGRTAFEPKLPGMTGLFLAVNLLFTCVAEEAFFRGWVQEEAGRLAGQAGATVARVSSIGVSAALFGLAHAGGGPAFVLFATIAGLGYALVYARTRSLEAAILAHFIVNAAWFTGFAYPALAR